MKNTFLIGEKYYLRRLERDDINERYLSWMNDKEVVKYLSSGFRIHTIEGLLEYWKQNQNKDTYFLAIVDKGNDKHIGNAKLAITDKEGQVAELGMLVGEKDYWGKGCMYEVYSLLVRYAFNELNIKKITLGAEVSNIAAIITFKKVGFELEKILKDYIYKNGRHIDVLRFALSLEQYSRQRDKNG